MTLASLFYINTLLSREVACCEHEVDVLNNKVRVYKELSYTRGLTEKESAEYERCSEMRSCAFRKLGEARAAYNDFSSKDWT